MCCTHTTIFYVFTFLPEKRDVMPGAKQDMTPAYVYVAVAIIATLVLFLCVGSAVFKM